MDSNVSDEEERYKTQVTAVSTSRNIPPSPSSLLGALYVLRPIWFPYIHQQPNERSRRGQHWTRFETTFNSLEETFFFFFPRLLLLLACIIIQLYNKKKRCPWFPIGQKQTKSHPDGSNIFVMTSNIPWNRKGTPLTTTTLYPVVRAGQRDISFGFSNGKLIGVPQRLDWKKK